MNRGSGTPQISGLLSGDFSEDLQTGVYTFGPRTCGWLTEYWSPSPTGMRRVGRQGAEHCSSVQVAVAPLDSFNGVTSFPASIMTGTL
jgi:hypothetical protein